MDDAELIAAVARGDNAALRELFGRHAPWQASRRQAALFLRRRAAAVFVAGIAVMAVRRARDSATGDGAGPG